MNILKSCVSKDTINRVKRMGEIFANHIYNKGLVYRIYREFLKLNKQNPNKPNQNWAQDLN